MEEEVVVAAEILEKQGEEEHEHDMVQEETEDFHQLESETQVCVFSF